MLTDQDISRLIKAFKSIFATKEEVATDIDEVRKDVSLLRTAVDNYAKQVKVYHDEVRVMGYRITNLENLLN